MVRCQDEATERAGRVFEEQSEHYRSSCSHSQVPEHNAMHAVMYVIK